MRAHLTLATVLLVSTVSLMIGAGQALAAFPATPLNIGTVPAGKSITITFEVTVNSPFLTPDGTVCAQGTVSGVDMTDVLTDDPDIGGADDPTCTPVTGGVPVELSRFRIE
jgi:hypothetical protein